MLQHACGGSRWVLGAGGAAHLRVGGAMGGSKAAHLWVCHPVALGVEGLSRPVRGGGDTIGRAAGLTQTSQMFR